jgi:prefoldin subunit 5
MGVFDKVISSLVSNAVKTTVKSSIRFDELISKLKDNCPSNQELQNIINQKNQLSQTLNLVQNNLSTLNGLTNTINNIIPPVDTAIKTIKSLPFPVSFPPGAGIPINLIIKLSDTLELLKDLIQQGKISIKTAQQAFKIISDNITKVQNKLNQLDIAITLCATKTGYTGSISNSTSGITSNPALNVNINNELENRLSSNSTNPLIYKGWRLILQTDPNNTFSFPRRRVIAQRKPLGQSGVETLISDYGPPGSNGYSYSSDTQVLVNDIKFKIDNPNWKPGSILTEIEEISTEATRQAEETKRGKVIFFGRTGNLQNIPLGNPSGYDPGEYPTLDEDLRPENKADRISSARIGRGLRLTIYKSPNFLLTPGQSNTAEGIEASYAKFEHPLDAEQEYLEVFFDWYDYNDKIESFIIQKLPGGLIIENPPIKSPVLIEGGDTYILKRKSLATLRNENYEWINGPVTVYDVYVKNDNNGTLTPPTPQTINEYKTIRAIDSDDAKEKIFNKYGLNNGVWKDSNYPYYENIIYTNDIYGIKSFIDRVQGNSIGNYTTIDNQNKIYYIEKISF